MTDFNTSKILNNRIIFILSNQSYKVLGKIAKSGIKLGSTTHTGKKMFYEVEKYQNVQNCGPISSMPLDSPLAS